MRLVRVGRYIVNLDRVGRATGLEKPITLTGPEAEGLRALLATLAPPWRPAATPRPRPRPRP